VTNSVCDWYKKITFFCPSAKKRFSFKISMKQEKKKIIKKVSEGENTAKKEIKRDFPLIKPFVFDEKQETPEQLKNKTLSLNYAWLGW
jgi:hypothetical protein